MISEENEKGDNTEGKRIACSRLAQRDVMKRYERVDEKRMIRGNRIENQILRV